MRSLRSSLATTSSAPSSIFLRPIFQVSATRNEYCSMVSGSVVGTISTATWLPFLASKFRSVWFSEAISSLESVPVRSTTRPTRGGTATSAKAAKAQHSISARREALAAFIAAANPVHLLRSSQTFAASSKTNFGIGARVVELFCRRRGRWIEVHLRRGRDFLFVLDREIRLLLIPERHRRQVGRERANRDVIVLHGLDVAVARHRDAVLGAFQLRHQVVKQRVGFELRIILGHHKQSRQCAREFALRRLELLERRGIVEHLRRGLDAADLGAGIGHPQQHILFLLRKTFHRIDEVGNQIGAALVLVDDLRPARLDLFVLRLNRVVAAIGEAQCRQRRQHGPKSAHRILLLHFSANIRTSPQRRQRKAASLVRYAADSSCLSFAEIVNMADVSVPGCGFSSQVPFGPTGTRNPSSVKNAAFRLERAEARRSGCRGLGTTKA